VRLAEAPSHGKPALLYDVRSRGAESYIRLAKEMLERSGLLVEIQPQSSEPPAEAQVVNAPRWKRWITERNKLTIMTINR